jgi:hypothetical protein
MIPTYTYPKPVGTEIIRAPASGPKPCNTLAFIRCNGAAGTYLTSYGDLFRYKIRFTTKFQIDGFTQANLVWYQENTLVSATAFIRLLNLTSDMSFVFAVDSVQPFIDDDGKLGFECQLGMQVADAGFFEKEADSAFSYTVSAYVLLYEPREEPPPPSVNFGKKLSLAAIPPQFGKPKKQIDISDEPSLKWKQPK